MPKAKLEFDLPEEQDEFKVACDAGKYYSAIFQFDQELRSIIKYQELDEKEYEVYEKVRQMLWDQLDDAGINMDF